MKAYIAVSFSKRKTLENTLKICCQTLQTYGYSPFIFVDAYHFSSEEESTMMNQVITDISNSSLLIAETSEKGIGIGVEVGYAKALGKPIIYLRQHNKPHSTTVSGISDYHVIYTDNDDLNQQLSNILNEIKKR